MTRAPDLFPLRRADRWRPAELAFWLIPVLAYFVFPDNLVLLTQIAITALFCLSLDLILGYAGILSLGHAAFFGLGAYAAGLLAANGFGDPLAGLAVAALASAAAGFVSGFLVLRGADLTRLKAAGWVAPESITVKARDGQTDLYGQLFKPSNFDAGKKYAAIVCAHPISSCKEQTSGAIYGEALTKAGFITLAFDASTQGASGGEPRFLEDPATRVEDFRCAVDYLVTLPYVNEEKIGVLGVCGGGGYAVSAAMTDRRFKAVGTVVAANYGRLMREGRLSLDEMYNARGKPLTLDELRKKDAEAFKLAGL